MAVDSMGFIEAWQCVGCGRLEVLQNCVGVCQDRKVQIALAEGYQVLEAQLELIRRERDMLREALQLISLARPREGAWEENYHVLQSHADSVLKRLVSVA